jgi:hypothetical protein
MERLWLCLQQPLAILQSSPDLYNWTPVATDTLNGSVLDITNLVAPGSGRQFWRALLQP